MSPIWVTHGLVDGNLVDVKSVWKSLATHQHWGSLATHAGDAPAVAAVNDSTKTHSMRDPLSELL